MLHAVTERTTAESELRVRLSPGVSVGRRAPGRLLLSDEHTARELSDLAPGLDEALLSLGTSQGQSLEELLQRLVDTGGTDALAQWTSVLRGLESSRGVLYEVVREGVVVARLVPGKSGFDPYHEVPVEARVRLSRFAYLRGVDDQLVIDAPRALGPVILVDAAAIAAVTSLASACSVAELSQKLGDYDGAWVARLVNMLDAVGMLTAVNESGEGTEDRNRDQRTWSFPDLLFHASHRSTRRDRRVGATYPWKGVLEPMPALKRCASGERITLVRPDLTAVANSDASFTSVMEARRSVRRHGAQPLMLAQLSEFLYRVAHVRDGESRASAPYEVVPRVYPSSGACYPLELYPVVGRCEGLAAGAYRYDAVSHALEPIADDTASLLESTAWVMENNALPDILFVITARFGRVAWKYEGMAYATILKDVGVLIEAMYLVATAMRLAPCAVGAGSTATAERILNLEPLAESPVGEFVLGNLPNQS